MKYTRITALIVLPLFFSGCASTSYKASEGENTIYVGKGGTRSTMNGIDFWEHGDPPRKFMLIGIIEDERSNGSIPMALLKDDITNKAKEQGADAVVVLRSGSEIRGYFTQGVADNTLDAKRAYIPALATPAPSTRNSASFAVIKYID